MATRSEQETVLKITRRYDAPVEKVYAAWTTADALKRWFGPGAHTVPEAEVDLRVGGRYRIVMNPPDQDVLHVVGGEYREIVPNERLVFTWVWETQTHDVGETLVTVTFKPDGAGSILHLTHERLPDTESRDKHEQGWQGCLENLAAKYLGA